MESTLNAARASKNPEQLELEIRFYLNHILKKRIDIHDTGRIASQLIKKFGSKNGIQIEQTINFVTNKNITQQRLFKNAKQIVSAKKFYDKQILSTYKCDPFKVSVAHEIPIKQFQFDNNDIKLIRIRLRISTFPLEFGDWRLDITLIQSFKTKTPTSIIRAKKDTLFAYNSYDDLFVDNGPWLNVDKIEFEAEYIGKPSKIAKIKTSDINNLITQFSDFVDIKDENQEYRQVIYEMAQILKPRMAKRFLNGNKGVRHIANAVIELGKSEYQTIWDTISNYYITDKADGERCIIRTKGGVMQIITNILVTKKIEYKEELIVDAELIMDGEKFNIYIFDVIKFQSELVYKKIFCKRLPYLDKAATILANHVNIAEVKPFVRIDTAKLGPQIRKLWNRKAPYPIDGIIFTPSSETYSTMKVYKWKPPSRKTIDFLIKKAPKSLLGYMPYNVKKDHTLYILLCGIDKNVANILGIRRPNGYDEMFPDGVKWRYFPIPFTPSDDPYCHIYYDKDPDLDDNIGEFGYNGSTWELHNIRKDKTIDYKRGGNYGNDHRICEFIWDSYQNPLTLDRLIEFEQSYFKQTDSQIHKPQRAFNSFVKSHLLMPFKKIEWLLDLAAGRGTDLFRYNKAQIRNVMFVDNDRDALSELIKRKYDLVRLRNPPPRRMGIWTTLADLSKSPSKDMFKQMPENGFPLIVCNFAIHYFCDTTKNIRNFLKFVASLLCKGGMFIYTAFDGLEVQKLLARDKHYEVKTSDNQIKYSIIKKYDTPQIVPGKKIGVLLPFSNNKHYDEYLVYAENIKDIAIKCGMKQVKYESFSEKLDLFESENVKMYQKMRTEDKLYSGLYHYGIYQKV